MEGREPIFNVPGVVLAVLAVLVAVHFGQMLLPEPDALWWLAALAFVPARYAGLAAEIPGGEIAAFSSPVTHMLVHANGLHLVLNSAWLLAFGAPLARRIGALRFIAFSVASGLAGALAFYIANPDLAVPMIGASGAVAGMMGGVMRFLFPALDLHAAYLLRENPGLIPRMALARALQDRRVLGVTAIFIAINLFAIIGFGQPSEGGEIAWQAHIGGYLFGLFAFAYFDIAPQYTSPMQEERD